jgi:hypothetical protein
LVSVWRVILATFVIFCAGVIAGGVAVNQFHLRRLQANPAVPAGVTPDLALWPRTPTNNVPPSNPSAWKRLTVDFLDHFGKELELSPDQRQRIEVIITDSQKRTKELSDQLQPKLREEVRQARDLIRAELDPDQRRRFDAIHKGKPSQKKSEKKPAGDTNAPAAGSAQE